MADKFLVSRPAGNRIMNLADDDLRENARTLKALLEVEHSPLDGSDEVDGKHKYVTLAEQGADIAQVADRIAVYAKEVATITELFTRDSAGNVTQITSAGEAFALATALHRDSGATDAERFMEAALRMANSIAIVGRNFADDDDLGMMELNADDHLNIGDAQDGTVQAVRLRVDFNVTDPEDQFFVEYGLSDQKIWHAGNDGDGSGLDADLVRGSAPPFLENATSPELTPVSSGILVWAHGLSARPNLVVPLLRCITAEHGYTAGDELYGPLMTMNTDFSGSRQHTWEIDATNVTIHNMGACMITTHGGAGGDGVSINNARWRWVITAYV